VPASLEFAGQLQWWASSAQITEINDKKIVCRKSSCRIWCATVDEPEKYISAFKK
jgi:hypothetical protein